MFTDPRQAYRDTHATTSVSGASPHKLIALLFDACQESLATAKGAMMRGEVREKAIAIKKAIDIVVRLQAALDFEKGGVIATRLDDLYTFCTNRLAMANAVNDAGMIDEVYKVVAELKLGWSQIEGGSGRMSEQTSASVTFGSASSLAKVLLMTENMLAYARDDSWDAVTELEELRREALATCFAAPIPPSQAEVFSEALAAMLHMNEEMIGLLEAAKANVAIKRSDQTHTKRSLGHYLDVEQSH